MHVSGPRARRGAAHAARPAPAEGGDADPRRVPDAGRARAARAGRRRAGVVDRDRRERRRGRALAATASRIVDQVEAGVTFVDGLGVGDISDVALRDRRHLSEDGVLIVVATLVERHASRGAGADLARLRRVGRAAGGDARARRTRSSAACSTTTSARSSSSRSTCTTAIGQLVYDRTRRRPMILPGRRRGMSDATRSGDWAEAIAEHAARDPRPAARLIAQLPRVRGRRARVLPAARALGARRGGCRRRPAGARRRCGAPPTASRRRCRARAAARPLPARARAGARRGPVVVRRAGRAPSSSTGSRC